MPAFVALLRAINIGGRAAVAMPELREIAGQLSARTPRTLLQSGNLLFEAEAMAASLFGARLEAALSTSLGLKSSVLIRSAADWSAMVAALPFPNLARSDPSHLLAMALRTAPDASRAAALQAAIPGREQLAVVGATAYIAYHDGIGRSKLSTALIERELGTIGTGRNWRTVLKIASALDM